MGIAAAQRGQYKQITPGQVVAILRQASDINPDGSYQYRYFNLLFFVIIIFYFCIIDSYETENGISAEEQGAPKVAGPEGPAVAAQGGFRYTAPDGTPVEISYIADENGFQPQGNVLPQAPPIPDYILRSIAYNEAHPETDQPKPPVYRRP